MTETGRLVFAWGRVLFAADIAGPRLVLSWRSIDTRPLKHGRTGGGNQLARNSSDSDDDDDEGIVSRHATSATHRRSTQNGSPDGNTSWFDVSRWTDCQVVAARPTCSQGLVKKQLVLLLKCANVQSGCRTDDYLFIQVREMPGVQSSHVSDDSLLSENRCKTAKYSLVLLQSYSFDTSHNLTSHKHLAVLPDLQLLLLNPDTTSVMFCTPNATSSHDVQLKDISSAGGCKSISDSQIIDAISIAEDRAVIALVSYRTADKLAECQCFKFSPACATSTQSYDLTQLPLELLFAAHYAHILKAASISSFTYTYDLLSKSTNFHTSLIMLTETGYALRFIDGALRCCVNLSGHNDSVWSPETWALAFVKVISFDGCPDRTAVQLNSACHLVDWATDKVVKCWQSVSAAVSCDVDLCGVSSLILVCLPESAACPATTTSRPLQECLLAVVDVDDVCADDAHKTVLLDSGKTRQGSQQHVGAEEHVNQALCAASALQCKQAVSEMESQLKNKLSFLSDTWQHLTNLPVSGDGQSMSQTASPDQLSMAVLVEGSVPSLSGREKVQVRQDSRRPGKKYVEAGSAWKRLVDSSLVVGVPVRNVSLSHLRDVQIRLVPVPHCQSRILETVSKLNMYSSKLASINSDISIQSGLLQEPTSQNEFGQDSEFNRHEMLPPGKSTVATCTTDISAALGAHDLTVHIFLSYSVLSCGKSLVEESRESKVCVTDVDEYCAQVVVTSSDMLDDVCSLGASRDVAATLTTTDLLALDCVQKHWTLLVLSVVSPVTCLSLRLSQDSRVRHLEWAQQFLFLGTPVLQYSRLQVLELSGRYKSTVKIFARSHSQALLLVRFLYTILPEDVTITLDTSHNSLAVRHISCALLEDIECQATAIKQQLAAASPSNAGTSPPPDPGTSPPAEGSLSPKFLSCRQRGGRQAADYVGAAGEACGQASVADISSSSQGTGDVATEKRRFRIARRRFREIWGDDDSP
ncbi:hypothetical protein BsWGS_27438 [Bradybaena similaris]